MSTCKVCGKCSKKNPQAKFFRFPKDFNRCAQWTKNCNLYDAFSKSNSIYFNKTYRICSDHFSPTFIQWDGHKAKLMTNAAPNVCTRNSRSNKNFDQLSKSNEHDEKAQINLGCKIAELNLEMMDNVCRFCSLERKNLTMLFGPYGKSLNLPTKVKYIPIQLSENDVMPTRICRECIKKVEEGYLFVKNCVEADEKLRMYLDMSGKKSSYEKITTNIAKHHSSSKSSPSFAINSIVQNAQASSSCDLLREIDLSRSLALQNDYADMFMKASGSKPKATDDVGKRITKDKNARKFSCRYCHRNFRTIHILNAHAKAHLLIKDKNGNFTCDECKVSFQNRFHLSSHRRRHFNEKPYECLECNARFYTSSLLRQHEYTHSPKQFACDSCKKVFLRKSKLLVHIQDSNHFYRQDNVECTEKTNYKCVTCTKSFSKLSSLQRHWKAHWRVNNFLCAFCGKLFTRMDSLTKHYRIHTGERPYSCYVCGFSFKQRGDCKKHEDNH